MLRRVNKRSVLRNDSASEMPDGGRTRYQDKSGASTNSKNEDKMVVKEIYHLLFPNKVMAEIDLHSSLKKGSTFLPWESLLVPAIVSIFMQAPLDDTQVADLLNRFAQESSADEPAVEASGKKAFNTSQHQSVVLLRLFCSPEFHHHPLNPPTGPIGGKKPAGYSKDVLGWDEKKLKSVASVIEYCVLGFMKNPDLELWKRAVAFVKPVQTQLQQLVEHPSLALLREALVPKKPVDVPNPASPPPLVPVVQQASGAPGSSAYQLQSYGTSYLESHGYAGDVNYEDEQNIDDDGSGYEQDSFGHASEQHDDGGTVPRRDEFSPEEDEPYDSPTGGHQPTPTPQSPKNFETRLNMYGEVPEDLPLFPSTEEQYISIENSRAAEWHEVPLEQQPAAGSDALVDKFLLIEHYLNEKGANDSRNTFVSGFLPAEGATLALPLEDAAVTQVTADPPLKNFTFKIPLAFEERYPYYMNCLDENSATKVQRCKHFKNCKCILDEFFDYDDDVSRPAAKRHKLDSDRENSTNFKTSNESGTASADTIFVDHSTNADALPMTGTHHSICVALLLTRAAASVNNETFKSDESETATADTTLVDQRTNARIAPMICTLALFFLWHRC